MAGSYTRARRVHLEGLHVFCAQKNCNTSQFEGHLDLLDAGLPPGLEEDVLALMAGEQAEGAAAALNRHAAEYDVAAREPGMGGRRLPLRWACRIWRLACTEVACGKAEPLVG